MDTPAESAVPDAPKPSPILPPLAPRSRPKPLDETFISSALTHPLRAIDLSLAEPDRVGANVVTGVAVARIAWVLLLTSLVFAIPYGCVLSLAAWWKVVALTLGSTLICLPSLYVFSSYLGQRMKL